MAKPELPALRQPRPSFCMMPHLNARAVRHLVLVFTASEHRGRGAEGGACFRPHCRANRHALTLRVSELTAHSTVVNDAGHRRRAVAGSSADTGYDACGLPL
jgi:hypothetical protein